MLVPSYAAVGELLVQANPKQEELMSAMLGSKLAHSLFQKLCQAGLGKQFADKCDAIYKETVGETTTEVSETMLASYFESCMDAEVGSAPPTAVGTARRTISCFYGKYVVQLQVGSSPSPVLAFTGPLPPPPPPTPPSPTPPLTQPTSTSTSTSNLAASTSS